MRRISPARVWVGEFRKTGKGVVEPSLPSTALTKCCLVLAINPNYMPALIGLADVEWDSGDKASAIKMYKDIVEKYPPGTYPGRVQQRSEGG